MSHDDDAGDDLLASVNLHAWRVPPPAAERSAILSRGLSPAAPARHSRTTWMFVAFAIANVVLAAIVVIVISRRPPRTITVLQPAGGGDIDAETKAALRRLEEEQRTLEGKLADVQQLRTIVAQLSERVRQCEQTDKSNKLPPKPRPDVPPPSDLASCDEVSCTLSNFEGACCTKYRRPSQAPAPSPTTPGRALPDTLDRQSITAGIASIRALIQTCGQQFATVKGSVKVRVRVSPAGRVENTLIESTPDAALGGCVAGAVQKAIFEPTFHGGAFTYPFVFGAH